MEGPSSHGLSRRRLAQPAVSPGWKRRVGYHVLALLFVGIAALLRWLLPGVLGPTPYLVFYLSWVGAAVFGGLGPGLLATAASWLCVDLLFDYTPGQSLFHFNSPAEVGRFLVLMAGGLTVSLIADRMRRGIFRERRLLHELGVHSVQLQEANEQLAASNEELRATTEELHSEIEDRRQAEQALRQSEDRFRTMANAMPQLAWIANADGYIYWYNRRWYDYTGTTPEQMEGWGWQSVHDPRELPKVLERWKSSIATGQPFDMVFPLRGADGIFRPFLTRVMPLKDDQGRVQQWFGTNTDISEQKRAQEAIQEANEQLAAANEELAASNEELRATTEELQSEIEDRKQAQESLRESEKKFRELFESMIEGYCVIEMIFDENGKAVDFRYLETNPAFVHHATQPMLGKRIKEIVADFEQYWLDQYGHVVRTGEPVQSEHIVAGLGNQWFHTSAFRIGGQGSRKVGVVFENITERKRAEAALRQSEEKFATAFAANAAAIALTRVEDGRFIEVNDTWVALTGYRREEAVGQSAPTLAIWLTPEARGRFVEELRAKGAVQGWEQEFRKKSGARFVAQLSAQILSLQDEEVVLSTLVDITGRVRAEAAVRELNATLESKVTQRTAELAYRARQLQKLTLELTQAEERERRRIAVILHEDLQQQIAGAKFHLNLVRNRITEDRQRAALDKVDDMLTGVIEQSRRLSRDLSPPVVRLNDLAEVLSWLVNRVREQQGLEVQVSLAGDMVLQSEALATFLFRAAQEMLLNVVKHARVREAAIRVRRTRHSICLSISDQGRGFDPQELRQTSGVGLFGIRERTELLGGRMKIRSGKGKGSRFTIMVPDSPKVKRGRETQTSNVGLAPESVAVSSSGFDGGGLRVLLVDDHDIVREGLAALLQEASDIQVVGEAPDGREAINLAIDLRPDVVIMDVSMPVMSGDQATRQIKAHVPNTRVIALSMYDEAEKRRKMFEAGAESYMLKTASAEELLAVIRGERATRI